MELDLNDLIGALRDKLFDQGVRLQRQEIRNMVKTMVVAFCRQFSHFLTSPLNGHTDIEHCVETFYRGGLLLRPSRFSEVSKELSDCNSKRVIHQDDLEDILEHLHDKLHRMFTNAGVKLPYSGILNLQFSNKEWAFVQLLDTVTLDEVRYELEREQQPRRRLTYRDRGQGEGFDEYLTAFNVVESMYRFREWLGDLDQERLKPIPSEMFELIDRFIDGAGWMK